EGEPLLADDERDLEDALEPDAPAVPPLASGFAARFQAKNQKTIIVRLLAVMLFTIALSGMLLMVPLFRIIEDTVCHVYYKIDRSEKIDELLCKVDEVQRELAYLGGLGAMLGSLVGFVAALPYGVLADRIGRKPTFIISYCGIILAFGWGPFMLGVVRTTNLYLVMIGSFFFLIGGGLPVAMNSLNAMAADVSSDADKSASFLHLSFGGVSGSLIGPFTAGILMEKVSPWLPICLVFGFSPFVVFGMLLFIPETLPIKLKTAPDVSLPFAETARKSLSEGLTELKTSFALLKNINILLCMVTFFIQPAIFTAYSATLSQYVSNYFGWTLAQTSYLLSPPLGILHLVIILLVPQVSKVLTTPTGRFRLSSFSKDLLLTRVSLGLQVLGALLEGFSQEIALFLVGLGISTLGSANGPLLRAISTSYVEPNQTSRLYSLMSMLETSGAILGGPVLAKLFSIGLARRGFWIGLPWFYVAGLLSFALAALAFVRKPP
ncbi:general substrate transporter, partial [Lasiosphaeris hirsuta]